jgi:DNA-binding MarR family transcriptional regulator
MENSAALMRSIERLIGKISAENHEEDAWRDLLSASDLSYKDKVTLSECHVIDYIGRNRLTNAVSIAHNLNISKGGISKITSRLLKKGFIELHRLEGNRKEIFFTLTPDGKKIFALHEKLHRRVQEKCRSLLHEFSPDELQTVRRFVDGMTAII